VYILFPFTAYTLDDLCGKNILYHSIKDNLFACMQDVSISSKEVAGEEEGLAKKFDRATLAEQQEALKKAIDERYKVPAGNRTLPTTIMFN
jgi:hypothetical protein